MRVAMVGLGKLGLPVAYAMGSRGIDVYGYDPHVWHAPRPSDTVHEQGLEQTIRESEGRMHFCGMADAVNNTDNVVFVAVQTPHEPRFEGVTPLPDDRADFDYTYLKQAVSQVVSIADALEKDITIAVISTVLPGTLEREVMPILSDRVSLVYNPSFIAMGTTIPDFLDPEFVLLGGDAADDVIEVYLEIQHTGLRFVDMSIRDAELTKVAYNTFIGLKIAFANTLMEICHKTGGDVDEVTGALKLAHRRLISGAYMDGGMGDGGGCHPRDNIALSWLAKELRLSHDLFGDVMQARQDQAEWLADMMLREARLHDLPLAILGLAYKPSSHITTGSAAMLVRNLLEASGHKVVVDDPHVLDDALDEIAVQPPYVFLIGCKHPEFVDLKLPEGSIVIDPFRYIPDQEGVEVVRVGERVVPDHGSARQGGELSAEAA